MICYRLALQQHQTAPWIWSITLTSLDEVLQHLARIRFVISLERIRVFTAPSKEEMDTLLSRENTSLPPGSVTAAHVLHDYLDAHEGVQRASAHGTAENLPQQPTAVATSSSLWENSPSPGTSSGCGMGVLEKRRLEMELGPGGDHDIPYLCALPISTRHLLAWAKLLARVQEYRRESYQQKPS